MYIALGIFITLPYVSHASDVSCQQQYPETVYRSSDNTCICPTAKPMSWNKYTYCNFINGEIKIAITQHTPTIPQRRPIAPNNKSSQTINHNKVEGKLVVAAKDRQCKKKDRNLYYDIYKRECVSTNSQPNTDPYRVITNISYTTTHDNTYIISWSPVHNSTKIAVSIQGGYTDTSTIYSNTRSITVHALSGYDFLYVTLTPMDSLGNPIGSNETIAIKVQKTSHQATESKLVINAKDRQCKKKNYNYYYNSSKRECVLMR